MSSRTAWYRASRRLPALALGLAVLGLWGCGGDKAKQSSPRKLAEFEAVADPATGQLTISRLDMVGEEQAGRPGPRVVLEPSANTIQLVTQWASYRAVGGALSGTAGHDCGKDGTFCGAVTVRSLFPATELHNVSFVIQAITPLTGNVAFATSAMPKAGQPGEGAIGDTPIARWTYPALLDATRGAVGGTAPGANAATRTWYFENLADVPFRLTGSVYADEVTPAVDAGHPYYGTCAGAATDLTALANCGECGRTAPAGSTCSYTQDGGMATRLDWTVHCSSGTACDSADAVTLTCVDLQTSSANCGFCGFACAAGETCTAGACVSNVHCTSPATVCGTACCPGGSTCNAGVCILSAASEIAVGTDHACAITPGYTHLPTQTVTYDGVAPTHANDVLCWGQNHFDELNTPNWTDPWPRASAVFQSHGTGDDAWKYYLPPDVQHLSAGGYRSAAWAATGGPYSVSGECDWGAWVAANFWGGNPAQDNVIATASGGMHTCWLMGNSGEYPRGVACQGLNVYDPDPTTHQPAGGGQLGNFPGPWWSLPGGPQVVVLGLTGTFNTGNWRNTNSLSATAIAAGGDTTCAVLAAEDAAHAMGGGQEAGMVACWGDNTSGKAGGTTSLSCTGGATYPDTWSCTFTAPVPTPLVPSTFGHSAVAVSVGGNHTVALLNDGSLAFWGANSFGQYGNGTTGAGAPTPTRVVPGRTVDEVVAGQDFTCYRSSGNVYCAGHNDMGQLGDGTTTDRHTFVRVTGVSGATAVRAGGQFTHSYHTHRDAAALTGFGSACALVGGNVLCWGDNKSGQLGQGNTTGYSALPVLVQVATTPAN